MLRILKVAALVAIPLLNFHASCQIPPPIAAKIKAMGRSIEPLETAKLYRPLQPTAVPRGVKAAHDIAYGPGAAEKFDLFVPANAKGRPIVIFLHGGAFRMGDKALWSDGSASPFYNNFMLWSVSHGMVGINMNYTLAPEATYPTVQRQIAKVVAWAREHALGIGGDPDKIILWGHSAGASHVASYIAHPELYRDISQAAKPVAAAVLQSGIYDMRHADADHIYFGQRAELGARSSLEGLLASHVPLFVSAAEYDPPIMVEQMEGIQARLAKNGTQYAALIAKDHGHMSEAYSINTGDDTVTRPLLAFLQSMPWWPRQGPR